jgi:transcriptional regulator with XRE-family HTH domain
MSEIEIVKPTVIDGIEFFVSSKGETGISISGLAVLCGVSRQTISRFLNGKTGATYRTPQWLEPFNGNYFTPQLTGEHNESIVKSDVCVAVIEYYALDSKDEKSKAIAKNSYRKFANKGFSDWVKEITGFASEQNNVAVLETLQQILTKITSLENETQQLKTEVKEYRNIRQTTTTIYPGMDYCLDSFTEQKAIAPAHVSVFLSEWLEKKGITLDKSNLHRFAGLAAATYKTMRQQEPMKVMRADKNGKGGSLTNVFFPEDYPILEVALKRLF